jgi:hypothetical protein
MLECLSSRLSPCILRNEKYRRRDVWNRRKAIWNPLTGRKEVQFRPESEWEVLDNPDLRIAATSCGLRCSIARTVTDSANVVAAVLTDRKPVVDTFSAASSAVSGAVETLYHEFIATRAVEFVIVTAVLCRWRRTAHDVDGTQSRPKALYLRTAKVTPCPRIPSAIPRGCCPPVAQCFRNGGPQLAPEATPEYCGRPRW